jgi:hypothetical protein
MFASQNCLQQSCRKFYKEQKLFHGHLIKMNTNSSKVTHKADLGLFPTLRKFSESEPSSPSWMVRAPPVRQMSSVRRRWPRSSAPSARMTSTASSRAEWTRPLPLCLASLARNAAAVSSRRELTPASSRAFLAAPLLTKLHPKLRREPLSILHPSSRREIHR